MVDTLKKDLDISFSRFLTFYDITILSLSLNVKIKSDKNWGARNIGKLSFAHPLA